MDLGATVGEGFIARFIRTVYASALLKKPVKYLVLALFGGLFTLSWIGARHIELGLGTPSPDQARFQQVDEFPRRSTTRPSGKLVPRQLL